VPLLAIVDAAEVKSAARDGLFDACSNEVGVREEREVCGREFADGGGPGCLGALKVGMGAAILGVDQVGGWNSFPRGGGRLGAEDDRRLRAEALVNAADEVGIGDVMQESGVGRGHVVVVEADCALVSPPATRRTEWTHTCAHETARPIGGQALGGTLSVVAELITDARAKPPRMSADPVASATLELLVAFTAAGVLLSLSVGGSALRDVVLKGAAERFFSSARTTQQER
jgi:hypothetical protein